MRVSRFALPVALLSGLLAGVPAWAATYADDLEGLEISAGRIVGQNRIGATFVGAVTGELPGLVSVSISYTPNSPGVGVTNTVIGGLWSMVICQNGRILGSIYGTVDRGGQAVWNDTGSTTTVATISITLTVSGGTGRYYKASGSADFEGFLSHLTFPPTIDGTLNITLK